MSERSSPWEILHARGGGPELALVYSSAFWPEFIEVEGLILLKENYDAKYLGQVIAEFGRGRAEQTINTTYLDDLFGDKGSTAFDLRWPALGRSMCGTWKARAESLFPGLQFIARFSWYSQGSDPGITIYQIDVSD